MFEILDVNCFRMFDGFVVVLAILIAIGEVVHRAAKWCRTCCVSHD